MRFQSVRLSYFRNYKSLSLDIPPGVVVFQGPNGNGKTNLMEAFYLLLRGESFRPASTESLLYHHGSQISQTAKIEARLLRGELSHDVSVSFLSGRREAVWNGRRVSGDRLTKHFPLVLFSPESLLAIKQGPEARRTLLDDVVMTHAPSSFKIIKEFRRALKTRNRVLKDFKRGLTPRDQAHDLIESIDPLFLPLAVELTTARLESLRALQDDFSRAIRFVLERQDVDISVEYLISQQNALVWSRSDLLSAMHKRSIELRSQELESGQSLIGPQRHDIRILFSGKDSRFFCSQGQQRALILSFKMAQILYHYRTYQVYPFLLLDDVLSELDPVRRANLVRFLRDIPAQIFLTTTDLSFSMDFGDRGIHVFHIDDGVVSIA
jgi:DNA replication and repair protein RecF